MDTTELGNIIEINKGRQHTSVFSSNGNGKKRYIQIDDLRNDNNLKYTDQTGVEVLPDDLIIAWDGANAGTIGFNLNGYIGSTLARLRIKDNRFNTKYLGWFLRSKFKQLRAACTGATIPHINKTSLRLLSIPKIDLITQQEVAQLLEQADTARQKRKAANALTDQFLQSTFLSMFGDPVKNNMKWVQMSLEDLGNWQSGGTPSRSITKYFKGDLPWYSSGELNGMFISRSKEYITKEAIQKSNAKVLEPKTLLLGMYDTAALKSSITTVPSSCNQAISFSRLEFNKADIFYVYHAIQYGKEHYKSQQRGVRQKNLNLTMIKNIKLSIPPLDLQQKFASIVANTEQLRLRQQQHAQELENLFQGLLQKYFG